MTARLPVPTNQKWQANSDGSLTNVNAGLCLDAYNNGTQLVLWSCNGQTNQKWTA
ncbi:ricin-type beta-trefoil lectin domain protein [Streptomyces sp. NPDC059928]|uniref:ricin-type beta-trefoil lectin domain protein n=1 Tax=unclassified Streptomyces TaxID=2593676 RepID=UPI00365CB743